MDDTKTEFPQVLLNMAKVEAHNAAMARAGDLCAAKAEDEQNRVDAECKCDGTGDYSAYHSLRYVEKEILALKK